MNCKVTFVISLFSVCLLFMVYCLKKQKGQPFWQRTVLFLAFYTLGAVVLECAKNRDYPALSGTGTDSGKCPVMIIEDGNMIIEDGNR